MTPTPTRPPRLALCVFCGSRPGNDPRFFEGAAALGRAIAKRGLRLVYGGAKVGMMGALADGALAAGGHVIGIIPKSLVTKEIAHEGLTELVLTQSMAERKERMVALSDAFIALPGGFGTYDELFETITLAQIGFHAKPNAILDIAGFYEPLVRVLEHTIAQGFAAPEHAALVIYDNDADRLLDKIASWTPPPLGSKKLDRRGTP